MKLNKKQEAQLMNRSKGIAKPLVSGSYLVEIAEHYLSENNILQPFLQCERVSLGLSLRLTEMGIENRIIVADVDMEYYAGDIKDWMNFDVIEHHFIKVGSKILDATAGQFKGMPKIYFGSCPLKFNCR